MNQSPEAKEVMDRLAGRESIEETLERIEAGLTPLATQVVGSLIGKNNPYTPAIGKALAGMGIVIFKEKVLKQNE